MRENVNPELFIEISDVVSKVAWPFYASTFDKIYINF